MDDAKKALWTMLKKREPFGVLFFKICGSISLALDAKADTSNAGCCWADQLSSTLAHVLMAEVQVNFFQLSAALHQIAVVLNCCRSFLWFCRCALFFLLSSFALDKRISLRSIQKAITLWGLIINYQFNP